MATIRVATYNVRGCRGLDRRTDPERIARIIKRLNVDILALQEVATQWGWENDVRQLHELAASTGLLPIAGPTLLRSDTPRGIALLTRWAPRAVRHMDLSFPGQEPRGALDVDLVIDGSTLRVICTHLGLRANERTEQVGRLLASLKRHPRDILIFAGDINEWFPFSANLKALNAGLGTQPTRATFPAPVPFLALDRLWVRAGRATRVSPRKIACWQARIASDHLPLCAEIFEE